MEIAHFPPLLPVEIGWTGWFGAMVSGSAGWLQSGILLRGMAGIKSVSRQLSRLGGQLFLAIVRLMMPNAVRASIAKAIEKQRKRLSRNGRQNRKKQGGDE